MIKFLKRVIKNSFIKRGVKVQRLTFKNFLLINALNTDHKKSVLISHTKGAFINPSNKHTAFLEGFTIANVFNELGYNVDIVEYNDDIRIEDINIDKYELIFGQGTPVENLFTHFKLKKRKVIHYATGMHPFIQTINTLKRLKSFEEKHGFILKESSCLYEIKLDCQTTLSDAIFIWGNLNTVDSYRKNYMRSADLLYRVTPFFNKINIPDVLNKNYGKNMHNFLWLGSSGLIHRGLDLVLDFFIENHHLNLEICGKIDFEQNFWGVYSKDILNAKNIKVNGFIDINSEEYKTLLANSTFVIYCSASEGASGSVLNAIGNGGLIPIVSREVGIDVEDFGFYLDDLSKESIDETVNHAISLSIDEIKERSIKGFKYVNHLHTKENFRKDLLEGLSTILKSK